MNRIRECFLAVYVPSGSTIRMQDKRTLGCTDPVSNSMQRSHHPHAARVRDPALLFALLLGLCATPAAASGDSGTGRKPVQQAGELTVTSRRFNSGSGAPELTNTSISTANDDPCTRRMGGERNSSRDGSQQFMEAGLPEEATGARRLQDVTCSESCQYSADGECDDGGPGAAFSDCAFGSDCTDCGQRNGLCSEDCEYSADMLCDDGGPGSIYSFCALGSDCTDCSVRSSASPPVPPSPPMLPPSPLPPFLPDGTVPVMTAAQLHSVIVSAPSLASLAIYLPAGSVLALGGAQIRVEGIDLRLISDGDGATLDAEGSSRIFVVKHGGRLQLEGITLVNGGNQDNGGAMYIRNATVVLLGSSVRHSASRFAGGMAYIRDAGSLAISDSSISGCSSTGYGGAIMLVDGSITVDHSSIVDAQTVYGQGGGMGGA
eukprot:7385162-Prymnesium_polylepis.1